MKEYFMKRMVAVLLAFGMVMSAVSCGAHNVPEGIWTGQDSNGDVFSVIFIGNQVFLPELNVPVMTGTFTFEKNAGICRVSAFQRNEEPLDVPFTINGATMNFGSDSTIGFSITLAKDTGTFSVPDGIGGIWSTQDGEAGLVFVNDIVYIYETGSSGKCEYTYSNGSGSISLDDPPRFLDFTVSGNTLTSTWRGTIPATPFIFTRQG
jgi:hypothetical protein